MDPEDRRLRIAMLYSPDSLEELRIIFNVWSPWRAGGWGGFSKRYHELPSLDGIEEVSRASILLRVTRGGACMGYGKGMRRQERQRRAFQSFFAWGVCENVVTSGWDGTTGQGGWAREVSYTSRQSAQSPVRMENKRTESTNESHLWVQGRCVCLAFFSLSLGDGRIVVELCEDLRDDIYGHFICHSMAAEI